MQPGESAQQQPGSPLSAGPRARGGSRARAPGQQKARACARPPPAARGPAPLRLPLPSPRPPPRRRRAPQPGHLGVLSLPKGLRYPLPQISAQVPAPFGLVHWPFLTQLKKPPVAAGRHVRPRLTPPLREESARTDGACALGVASFPKRRAGRDERACAAGRRACCSVGRAAALSPLQVNSVFLLQELAQLPGANQSRSILGTALLFCNDCTSSRLK